jgi:predicted dehydrogenase
LGANDRIRVGVAGIRGRGGELARWFAERRDVEVAYLCDVDSRLFAERVREVAEICSREPRCVQDLRVVLDDPEIDALVVATPDHWHALQTVWACQAGKDVYLEKPVAHNIWEGRRMVEAARKYGRVVQVGTQTRSAEYMYQAKDTILGGELREIHLVRVLNSKVRPTIGHTPEQPVPPGVDYDMCSGRRRRGLSA